MSGGADELAIVTPVGGIYQIEIWGLTFAALPLNIDGGIPGAEAPRAATTAKAVYREPALPLGSQSGKDTTLPPAADLYPLSLPLLET